MAPGLFRAPEMTLSQFYLDQGVCPSSNTKLSSLLLLYNVLKSSRVISSNFISFNIILATLFPLSFHINFRISLSISLVYPKSCYGFYLYYVESSNSWHVCVCVCVCELLSRVWLFATLWTVAHQIPLSMEFSSQEYCSELPFPPSEGLPDPGIKPVSPALAGRFFTTEPPGKPTT